MDTDFSRWNIRTNPPTWRPPTDIYESANSIVIVMEIAGMHVDDFSIEVTGRVLSISGIRPHIVNKRAYHQVEIPFGEFKSDFEIPLQFNVDTIDAIYNNGFLEVTVQKSPPQQVQIK
ncbi:MAG: Hsp20/alpha crystallin family protein [Anaerolineales bacterium]|jgi:HSP20 family protein